MKDVTLAEAMAMAVIRGDLFAAYALADKLQEERAGVSTMAAAVERTNAENLIPSACWEVIRWPEFIAFANRAGVVLDLSTTRIVITLDVNDIVRVDSSYIPSQGPPQENV